MSKLEQKNIERRGIACAGNWILDTVHTISHWPDRSGLALINSQHVDLGGGPANIALGLKAMQAHYPIIPVGLIGAGALGEEVRRFCLEAGLPIDGLCQTDRATTSQTHVMNVQGDSRTFFHHLGANRHFDAGSIDIEALSNAGPKLFYLGYLTLLERLDTILPDGQTEAARLLSKARNKGMKTCVDLASFKSEKYRAIVAGTLPAIDYLFANELEAGIATGIDLSEEPSAEVMMEAARHLKSGGVAEAVILHSPGLVVWCGEKVELSINPVPIPTAEILSAVGAGDAFAAGTMHGIHENWSPENCLDFGMRAAAACLAGFTATDGLKALVAPQSPK